MTSRASNRLHRFAPFAAALALIGALLLAPTASAQTTGSVSVTASIASELSLTLCDLDADFGDGLTSTGAAPQNTADAIGVTTPSSQTGGSVYYHWTPSCQVSPATGRFFHVVSTSAWELSPCATENSSAGASPTLRIANSDLRWRANNPNPVGDYPNAHAGNAFFVCGGTGPTLTGASGTLDIYGHYYLQISPTDQPGTFTTTTTWTLTPS